MRQTHLLPSPPQAEPVRPYVPRQQPLRVCVSLPHAGLFALRQQLSRDISAKGFGLSPIPFTVLQLLDLEKLLMLHPDREPLESRDNLLLTSAQQGLLARYVHRYYSLAQDSGDGMREGVYLDCLYALSVNSTQLTELLLPVSYDFSVTARPLALLWNWLSGLFAGHRQRSFAQGSKPIQTR